MLRTHKLEEYFPFIKLKRIIKKYYLSILYDSYTKLVTYESILPMYKNVQNDPWFLYHWENQKQKYGTTKNENGLEF